MFLNYLKIVWRNLWKHKGISFINTASLASGVPHFRLPSILPSGYISTQPNHYEQRKLKS